MARVVSEHAYGMLKGRWRILYKKTEYKLKNIRHVIMACIALHNICIARDDPCRPRWRLDIEKLHLIRTGGVWSKIARQIRSGKGSLTGSGISTSNDN